MFKDIFAKQNHPVIMALKGQDIMTYINEAFVKFLLEDPNMILYELTSLKIEHEFTMADLLA